MSGTSGLQAQLRVQRGAFSLELDLDVVPGGVVALLGPNGAGKSTALQALAGLVPMTGGSVHLAGRRLDGGAAAPVPPAERGIGVVFQDYLLFPHLSASDNVAFGLRARGMRRREADRQAAALLERFGLTALAGRRPAALSGGQAQRVALARALATDPGLLLLDEPLAALDVETRSSVRADLLAHLRAYDGATVLVTHDPLEAMVLADVVVVLERGRVVQSGAAAELARAPRTPYVASLVGLNLHAGTVTERDDVALDGGGTLVAAPGEPYRAGARVLLSYRPSAVVLHRSRPDGSARNCWPGVVTGLEQHAGTVRVALSATAGASPVLADVTAAAVAELGLIPGSQVWLAVKATEIARDAR